jgi:hypothetical protein
VDITSNTFYKCTATFRMHCMMVVWISTTQVLLPLVGAFYWRISLVSSKNKTMENFLVLFFIQVVICLNLRKNMFLSTFYTHQLNKFHFLLVTYMYTHTYIYIYICVWESQIRKLWTCICRVLVGKPEGRRPLVRPRHRWEDNIKMDLQEVGCWDVGVWTGLSWLRIGNAVMNLQVP